MHLYCIYLLSNGTILPILIENKITVKRKKISKHKQMISTHHVAKNLTENRGNKLIERLSDMRKSCV